MTDEPTKTPGSPAWEDDADGRERYELLRLAEELETTRVELEARNEQLTAVSRQLEASRNEFFDLYEYAPVAFVTLSAKGLVTRANKAARHLLTPAVGPLIGAAFIRCVPPADQGAYYRQMKRVADAGRPRSFEIRLAARGRPPRPVYVQASPRLDFEKRFMQWELVFFDLSEQRRLEKQLESSRQALALATEAGGIGIWNYDLARRQSHWNEQLYRLLGLPPGEGPEPEDRFFDFILPEDRKGVLHNIQAVGEGDDHLDLEFRIVRADSGEIRWLAARGTITRDPNGRPVKIQGVNFDITDRKGYEHALKESRRQFLSVLEHSLDVPFSRDVQKERYEYLSPTIERITGFSVEELLTMPSRELIALVHPEDQTRVSAEMESAYKTGIGKIEFRFRVKGGGYLWVSDHFTIRYDDQGRPLQRIGVMRDISEEKKAQVAIERQQRQLTEKVAELERSNRELSEYAYAASHDLKAPLRAVRNYVDFLSEDLDGRLSGDQKSYLEGMKEAVSQGNALIRDLLQFSRIGQNQQPPEPVDLEALVREICSAPGVSDPEQVTVRSDCGPLVAERMLLKIILGNLIENGLKFNTAEDKRVEIRCRLKPDNRVELTVEDNGIGIGERYRERIFRVFQRLHPDSAYNGTGIGLALVRKAALEMGGDVHLESTPGKGSTFIVDLPRTPPAAERPANPDDT